MNSGTGNLIGSVSYELASDEACRTKAQHEVGPSPSKPNARPAKAAPRPTARQAQRAPKAMGLAAWAAARTHAWAALVAAVCVCKFVFMHDS